MVKWCGDAGCSQGSCQVRKDRANVLRRLARAGELPSTVFLRAADALHLTCAAEEGCTAIHTSDRHMIAAAPGFGQQAVTL